MWTEIFVTQNFETVQLLCAELKKIKVITRISGNNGSFRVLVPFAEVNEALNLIIDLGI